MTAGEFGVRALKATAATAIVLVAVGQAEKLPAILVVKGKDTRPFLIGAVVMLGLMMLPAGIKPIAAPPA